jgi:putative MATE family efflux protein
MPSKTRSPFREESFLDWDVGKLLLHFSVPCVLSLLVGALYNIVDQIFVGQGIGYLGNAATNVVYPITVIGLGFAYLLGDGCAAFLSISLGKGEKDKGSKAVSLVLVSLFVISALIILFGFCFQDQLLTLFGATDSCIGYAREYYRIILSGMFFYIVSSGLNSVIRADGSPRYSMLSMIAGAVVNLILDPIAILAMNLGMAGAAWATIIGQFVSFCFSIIYLWRSKNFKIHLKTLFAFDSSIFFRVLSLGVSSFITQISIVLTCIVTNNVMIRYGASSEYGSDIPLAVMGIVMKVFSIVIAIVLGISIGGQPIIGYNYGARKYGRVLKTMKLVFLSCGIVGAVATILFEAIPQYLILIFGNGGEEYMKFSVLCFRIYLGAILLTCLQKSCCISLQSLGKPWKAILLSLIRDTITLLPAVLILPLFLGIEGALWSGPVSDILAILVTGIVVSRECHKIALLDKEQTEESKSALSRS